ncbi:MAG: protease inhibitor I42 family protein [Deltaproteobacteria bacterium]|nr:protease inhibitor I42 family protein [Deltaproteobacteria bacterium]
MKKKAEYYIAMSLIALLVCLFVGVSSMGWAVMLDEKDAGRTVEIRRGEILEISLQGNPTTGYMWEVDFVDKGVLSQTGEAEFIPDRIARGAGGKVVLRFEAARPGKTALRLVYHRSFEKDIPPVMAFEVNIVVKKEEK